MTLLLNEIYKCTISLFAAGRKLGIIIRILIVFYLFLSEFSNLPIKDKIYDRRKG
jgi:hypothetical protein